MIWTVIGFISDGGLTYLMSGNFNRTMVINQTVERATHVGSRGVTDFQRGVGSDADLPVRFRCGWVLAPTA